MKLKEFIDELQSIYDKYGDTNVYIWNDNQMKHIPVEHVKFPLAHDFVEGLSNEKDYVEDFNMIVENVVIG